MGSGINHPEFHVRLRLQATVVSPWALVFWIGSEDTDATGLLGTFSGPFIGAAQLALQSQAMGTSVVHLVDHSLS